MKFTIRGLLFLLVSAPLLASAAGPNWMSSIDGSLPLTQLSIPGTHDAGALYEPISGTTKCQNLSLAGQLNAGVRFLDIRCRHVTNSFLIHHGQIYQKLNFDEVLESVFAFLAQNPSETVIMSVKEEYTAKSNTRSFEQTFDAYIFKSPAKWYLGANSPVLSAARGKIVLFRRFGARGTPKGIDASVWPDNATFNIGEGLRVQDGYQVSNNDAKWNSISNTLSEAVGGKPNTLFVNFTSGTTSFFGIPSIIAVSDAINPRVMNYFKSHPKGRYGVVVMDFVDVDRCSVIYGANIKPGS